MTRNITSLLFMLLICSVTYGQVGNVAINKSVVEEKINLQTDRDVYLPGETIWFHADYMINYTYSGTNLSKILYIELLNLKGEPVARDKFAIAGNSIDGSLVITEGLSTGYYILRAYTHYQRNFHSEQYATVLLTLINPAVPLPGSPGEKDTVIEVAFGNNVLINGVPSPTAVHFDSRIVHNIKSSSLLNQYSDTINKLEVFENGLGSFEFTPSDTLDYSLHTLLTKGNTIITPLTTVQISGLFLESKIEEGRLLVKLTEIPAKNTRQTRNYKLGVYSQGYCKLAETDIAREDSWQEIDLAPKCLGPGLIYLVLKDATDKIIQVKTLLKPVHEVIKLDVQTNKNKYDQKEIVHIHLKAANEDEDSIVQLSVSVVKKGTFNDEYNYLPTVIIKNPHLLPDFVYNHYQDSINIDQQIKMILTLYNSRLVADEQFKNKINYDHDSTYWLHETRGITVHGVVNNVSTKEPAQGVVVYAATIGDDPQFHIYKTNENGEFIFTLKHIADLNTVFLCLRSDDESTLEILVKSDFSRITPTYIESPLLIDTSNGRFIKELYVNAQITQNFNITDTPKVKDTARPIRFNAPLESILIDDYIPLPTLEDVFNELVPYVKARKRKGDFVLEVLDNKTNVLYGEPLILLDNIPIVDINELMKVPPQLVNRIDVINSTYVYGDAVLRGIIMIKTNTDDFGGIILPESSTFLEFNATVNPGDFNESVFSKKTEGNSRLPDFRNLLFWNPNIAMDQSEATISLTTSNHVSEYEVIVRGVTEKGKQVVGKASFEVANKNR